MRVTTCVLAMSASLTLAAAGPDHWPQWRGAGGQGVVSGNDLPTEWSRSRNVLWSTPIGGRGFSSPIVWGNRLFVTTSIEGPEIPDAAPVAHELEGSPFVHPDSVAGNRRHTLELLALDTTTGQVVWERTAYEGRVYDARHRVGSYANTTPATDGRYVYVWFGSEGLYAYDFDGRLAWKTSFGGIAAFGMGTGTSPVLFENLLILQCDEDNGQRSFVVAVDKNTGREVWRTARTIEANWTTPVIAHGPSGPELVTSGNQFIIAYDPRTGRELWRCKGTGGWTIPTPIVGHGIVVASASHPVKRAVAIRLGGRGDVTGTRQVAWERDRGTGYTPSSIAYGDYAYLLTDAGLLTCVDIRTGEVKYEGARPPKPGRFSGSPIAFDGKILLTSDDGDTMVIRAGPTYEVLRVNSLDEPIHASPAAAGGRLYFRTDARVYSIGTR